MAGGRSLILDLSQPPQVQSHLITKGHLEKGGVNKRGPVYPMDIRGKSALLSSCRGARWLQHGGGFGNIPRPRLSSSRPIPALCCCSGKTGALPSPPRAAASPPRGEAEEAPAGVSSLICAHPLHNFFTQVGFTRFIFNYICMCTH